MSSPSKKREKQDDDDDQKMSTVKKLRNNLPLTPGDRYRLQCMVSNYVMRMSLIQNKGVSPETEKSSDKVIEKAHKAIQADPIVDFGWEIIKDLKSQNGKKQPDIKFINNAMDKTFEVRRDFVEKYSPRIKTMYDVYPTLFNAQQMILEYERVHDHKGIYELFRSNLLALSKAVLDYSSYLHEEKRIVENAVRKQKSKEDKQYVRAVGALLTLPYLVEEEVNFIAYPGQDISWCFPYIKSDLPKDDVLLPQKGAILKIYIEQDLLCKTDNFIEAFFVFCASFYVFNIEYPQECTNTMAVFERVFVDIPPYMQDPPDYVVKVESHLKKVLRINAIK